MVGGGEIQDHMVKQGRRKNQLEHQGVLGSRIAEAWLGELRALLN